MNEILQKLRHWMTPWNQGATPMEIRRAILDAVESKVVAVGHGKKIFPYARLHIHLLAADAEERLVLEATAREGWNLEATIRENLAALGCQVESLEIDYDLTEESDPRFGERRFFIDFEAGNQVRTPGGRPLLVLHVTAGEAEQELYELAASRIHIGRQGEVYDRSGRLERRNQVAFKDEGDVNSTVSRKHASIRYDEAAGAYALRDDDSGTGTRIFREGRPIRVGNHRQGVRLQDGDEISLGRAQLRVELRL